MRYLAIVAAAILAASPAVAAAAQPTAHVRTTVRAGLVAQGGSGTSVQQAIDVLSH